MVEVQATCPCWTVQGLGLALILHPAAWAWGILKLGFIREACWVGAVKVRVTSRELVVAAPLLMTMEPVAGAARLRSSWRIPAAATVRGMAKAMTTKPATTKFSRLILIFGSLIFLSRSFII